MRKLVLIAAMLMASASAHAGNFSFNVEGQKVQVQIPRGCSSLSCINVTAPGLADKFNKDDSSSSHHRDCPGSGPGSRAGPGCRAADRCPGSGSRTRPCGAPPAANSKVTLLPPPTENTAAPAISAPPLTAPELTAPAPAPIAASAPAPVLAPAPTQVAAAPAPVAAPAPAPVANSPIGLWMAEKNEGKVVIEACGNNLCGWGIEKDGSKSAKMVLINMKPERRKVGRPRARHPRRRHLRLQHRSCAAATSSASPVA